MPSVVIPILLQNFLAIEQEGHEVHLIVIAESMPSISVEIYRTGNKQVHFEMCTNQKVNHYRVLQLREKNYSHIIRALVYTE